MDKLSGVVKNYKKGRGTVAALRGVDLVIEDGTWLAIQGPTGHGKSTLLQILVTYVVGIAALADGQFQLVVVLRLLRPPLRQPEPARSEAEGTVSLDWGR